MGLERYRTGRNPGILTGVKSLIRISFTIIALTALVAGCALVTASIYPITDLTISVGGGLVPQVAIGTFADVDAVVVTVAGEDRFGVYQDPLATISLVENGGAWTGTVESLPVGPSLTFRAEAFIGGTLAFSGTTVTVLTGSSDIIAIALAPEDDGTTITFPIIAAITLPAEIVRGTDEPISVDVIGSSNETLDFALTASGGGDFAPPAGSIVLPGSGSGAIVASYLAPSAVGNYPNTIRVTNSIGMAVITGFDTTVVHALSDAGITTLFAPVVTGISAERSGSEVTWEAFTHDDGTVVSHAWSFNGSPAASFVDPLANPAVLGGYDETITGTIELTITDDDGLQTTVSFALVSGQFPDVPVVHSTDPAPIALNGTGDPNELDYCVLQFPPAISAAAGASTPLVYGRVYETTVTEPLGDSGAIEAELGFGPAGSDPRDGGWSWLAATYNVQYGNDDEYQAAITVPASLSGGDTLAYTYRFALEAGQYTYCDLDGAGSVPGLQFDPTVLGVLTVE